MPVLTCHFASTEHHCDYLCIRHHPSRHDHQAGAAQPERQIRSGLPLELEKPDCRRCDRTAQHVLRRAHPLTEETHHMNVRHRMGQCLHREPDSDRHVFRNASSYHHSTSSFATPAQWTISSLPSNNERQKQGRAGLEPNSRRRRRALRARAAPPHHLLSVILACDRSAARHSSLPPSSFFCKLLSHLSHRRSVPPLRKRERPFQQRRAVRVQGIEITRRRRTSSPRRSGCARCCGRRSIRIEWQ